ncbi:MAG: hypothetical protein N4A63_01630 [Vallitalea sp.]|jgi:hypothetical protein|nr:hypothetical protein [Vallitalea sp.]
MIKGMLDEQAFTNYKNDLQDIISATTDMATIELNIFFLENRLKMLKEQSNYLEEKRIVLKENLEKIIAEMSGELLTINQLWRYAVKEEAVCEQKLKELKVQNCREGNEAL